MNYLAHAVLSFDREDILLGQFIADDVKGRQWQIYHPEIQRGILLHRFIDDFTDNHDLVMELKSLLRPQLGKYTGVALDVLFDHALSIQWDNHLKEQRESSIERYYKSLQRRSMQMSEKRRFITEKMIEHDWMNMYFSKPGTDKILKQMSSRIAHPNSLHTAMETFVQFENDVISTFDVFFPQLLSATRVKLDTFAP